MMVRKQVYLTEQQVERLNKEAKRLGLSFSEMLRRVIDTQSSLPVADRPARRQAGLPDRRE